MGGTFLMSNINTLFQQLEESLPAPSSMSDVDRWYDAREGLYRLDAVLNDGQYAYELEN